jgi:DNA-directed RNA polymerase subunit RPC12/RpoP
MAANVACPVCGHTFSPSGHSHADVVVCPAGHAGVPPKSAAAPSLLARGAKPGAAVANPNPTVMAEPEAMVRYTCPRCKKSLESPASFAGQKLPCPGCGQRLQIPLPSTPPAPPLNKTLLATEEPAGPAAFAARSGPERAAPRPREDELQVVGESAPPVRADTPDRTEHCLECGTSLGGRSRPQSCPDCGALFCSARCYREHRHHAHAPRKKQRTRYVECSYCGSTALPREISEISQGGWIMFVVLLVFFFPLCWIGLLMTERHLKCSDCGARLD